MVVDGIRSVIERSATELRAAGVRALYLFGSRARGEEAEGSDIDLLFEVENDEMFSLVDQASVQSHLQQLFGRNVDFVERQSLGRKMRQRVESEMIRLL